MWYMWKVIGLLRQKNYSFVSSTPSEKNLTQVTARIFFGKKIKSCHILSISLYNIFTLKGREKNVCGQVIKKKFVSSQLAGNKAFFSLIQYEAHMIISNRNKKIGLKLMVKKAAIILNKKNVLKNMEPAKRINEQSESTNWESRNFKIIAPSYPNVKSIRKITWFPKVWGAQFCLPCTKNYEKPKLWQVVVVCMNEDGVRRWTKNLTL